MRKLGLRQATEKVDTHEGEPKAFDARDSGHAADGARALETDMGRRGVPNLSSRISPPQEDTPNFIPEYLGNCGTEQAFLERHGFGKSGLAHPRVVNENLGEQVGPETKDESGQGLTEGQLKKTEANKAEALKRKQEKLTVERSNRAEGKGNDAETVAFDIQVQNDSVERPAKFSKAKSENLQKERGAKPTTGSGEEEGQDGTKFAGNKPGNSDKKNARKRRRRADNS